MSILSTNHRLISIGESYSAGSGIDITNQIISVTGDFTPYSAGENIDIQDHIISGKDWSQDITDASSNAYNETTAWVHDNYANSGDVSYLSAIINTKLDSSAWSTVSGDLATEEYVIMADNINYNRITSYIENKDYANKDFVLDNISGAISGKLDSSSFASISGDFLTTAFGISESGAWNEATNVVESNSAAWFDNVGDAEVNDWVYSNSASTEDITNTVQINSAYWNEVSSKVGTNEFTTISSMFSGAIDYVSANAGDEFPASANEAIETYQTNSASYATTGEVYNVSSILSAAIDAQSGNQYTGIDPIVVNNDNKAISANTWAFSAGDGISFVDDNVNKITRIDVTAQGGNPEVEALVQTNSGVWDDVTNKLDTTAFSTVSGSFLTAHQSLDGYATQSWVTGQGYLTGVSIPESGTWNDVSTTVQTNSAAWAQGGVPQSAFDELKASYDALSSLFATYSGQWLLPNEVTQTYVLSSMTANVEINDGSWDHGGDFAMELPAEVSAFTQELEQGALTAIIPADKELNKGENIRFGYSKYNLPDDDFCGTWTSYGTGEYGAEITAVLSGFGDNSAAPTGYPVYMGFPYLFRSDAGDGLTSIPVTFSGYVLA